MPRKPSENNTIISESSIPWSFIWMVYGKCGKCWDKTIDCFWKCRNVKGKNGVQKYILAGFRHPTQYMLQSSKEREDGQMESVRQWWLSLYERKRSTSKECDDMIANIVGKLSIGNLF